MDRLLPRSPRWRRGLSRVVTATLGAVLLAVLLWQRPSRLQVVEAPRLAPVVAGEFRDELVLRARVEPLHSVLLDAAEAGRVERVFVQDGDRVEAGAPLYRLHSPEQEQLLMQRSAEVAQQIANVSVQRSAHAAAQAQSRRELAHLQNAQLQAQSEYRRIASLAKAGFVSISTLEETQRRYQLATQLLQQARQDQRVEADIRQRALQEMARAVEGLQHGLELLQHSRERLEQHAPIAGRLSGFQLQLGTSVRPGDRLGRIDDPSNGVQLVVDVDEYYLPRLQPGLRANSSHGTLVLAQTLPQVRDGRVRALLRWVEDGPPPADLRPGQGIEVHLQLSPPAPALLVPDGPGVQSRLYVRSGKELQRRTVQLGRRAAGQVEVLAGLHVGEEVLVSQPPSDDERLALP